jgi:hypothetical protein
MGKVFERIMVYITGNGDNSRQPYVRLGKTFYIKGGSDHVRQQIELDEAKLEEYEVMKFNPDSQKFDIPYVEKLRVLPTNSIVFSNDRTLIEALMYGDINATAAMYNMEGKATNGFALNYPWYIDDLDEFVSQAKQLYGWEKRWWVSGRAYYNEREVNQQFHAKDIREETNHFHDEEMLKFIEREAKKESEDAGLHPLTEEMMDGSMIGGGPKVRQQYEWECSCITNRYGQRWTGELGEKAHQFVQCLIRDKRLDSVWHINNEECAEFYPVSHTKSCRYNNKVQQRMERASACSRHC